jgi:hypothetical protein
MATTVGDGTPDDVTAPGPITDRTDARVLTDDDIPSGLNGPFFQEIGRRKKQGRDAKCLVTADHGQTGVGKSNLCDFLAYVTDTTDDGFAEEKTTIDPHEFIELYSGKLPEGSAAIMEEAEQFDARRANAHENVDASQKWQQARVREIIAFLNLPSPSTIDKRFEELADFWINVERRGRARIYEKRIHRTKRSIYYKTLQTIEWPNMDGSDTFVHMDRLKGDMLDDTDSDDTWVRESEVQERVESAVEQAQTNIRDKWIRALKQEGFKGREIAALPTVDLSTSHVLAIARGE